MKRFHFVLDLPLVFLPVFYFFPLAAILQTSFATDGARGFAEWVADVYYARVLGFTLAQAALSTLLTRMAALPAAYLFVRYEFRGDSLLRAATTMPFLMPTVVVATAFSALLGSRGALTAAGMHIFYLDSPPVQIAISRFFGQPGLSNLGQAFALSTILIVLSGAAILFNERVRIVD